VSSREVSLLTSLSGLESLSEMEAHIYYELVPNLVLLKLVPHSSLPFGGEGSVDELELLSLYFVWKDSSILELIYTS